MKPYNQDFEIFWAFIRLLGKIFLFLLALLWLSRACFAADSWSKADVQREVVPVILYVVFFLLQLGDIYTTIRCSRNPQNYESYRLTAWLMKRIGTVQAIVLIRVLSIILIGGMVWYTRDILPVIVPMVVLIGLIVWYVRIVFKNWRIM